MTKTDHAPAETPWAADRVERRSVESLVPYAHNARTHDAAQVAKLADSIREYGWTIPVLMVASVFRFEAEIV